VQWNRDGMGWMDDIAIGKEVGGGGTGQAQGQWQLQAGQAGVAPWQRGSPVAAHTRRARGCRPGLIGPRAAGPSYPTLPGCRCLCSKGQLTGD